MPREGDAPYDWRALMPHHPRLVLEIEQSRIPPLCSFICILREQRLQVRVPYSMHGYACGLA
jgi:hypothetical protein